jgi:hypothetical protein
MKLLIVPHGCTVEALTGSDGITTYHVDFTDNWLFHVFCEQNRIGFTKNDRHDVVKGVLQVWTIHKELWVNWPDEWSGSEICAEDNVDF